MKYHLTLDGENAACGAVSSRPDTFLYNSAQFNAHYAKEHECKKCAAFTPQPVQSLNDDKEIDKLEEQLWNEPTGAPTSLNQSNGEWTKGEIFVINNNVVAVTIKSDGDPQANTWHLAQCYSPLARSKSQDGTAEAKANAERIVYAWNNIDQVKNLFLTQMEINHNLKQENKSLKEQNEKAAQAYMKLEMELSNADVETSQLKEQLTSESDYQYMQRQEIENLKESNRELIEALKERVEQFWVNTDERDKKSFRKSYPDHPIIKAEAAIQKHTVN